MAEKTNPKDPWNGDTPAGLQKPKDPWNGDKPAILNKSKPEAKGSGKKPKPFLQSVRETEESMGRSASRFFSREKGATGGEANRAQNAFSNSKTNKKAALKRELAKRKAQADASKKRRAGESETDYKKRLRTMTYGNPNE